MAAWNSWACSAVRSAGASQIRSASSLRADSRCSVGGVDVGAQGQAVAGAGQPGPGAGRLVGAAVVQDVGQMVADPGHPEHAAQARCRGCWWLSSRWPPGLQDAPGCRHCPASRSASRSAARWRTCGDGGISGLGGCRIASGAGAGPGRERQAEVAVVGVFGRDRLALPVGELVGERVVPGGQVLDPLAGLGGSAGRGSG